MVGVAVKVTDAPEQIALLPAMITLGTTALFTVMVSALEVALAVVAQDAFEVSIQVTTSPFSKEVVVNRLLLVPLGEPFTRH